MKKWRKNKAPPENAESAPTLLGSNICFEGKITGKDSVCIEGKFKGIVESQGNVYVNKKAKVQADIVAQNVFVHGEVIGNITAGEHLNIGPTGCIKGDVEIHSLTVITGGFLQGACKMKTKNETIELDKKEFDKYKIDAAEEGVQDWDDGITENKPSSEEDVNENINLLEDIVTEGAEEENNAKREGESI